MVAERAEVVSRRVHGRDVGLALVFDRERGAVGVVARIDQPHRRAPLPHLFPDLLHECRPAGDPADIPVLPQPLDVGGCRIRIAERLQVAVGVVGVQDGQGDLPVGRPQGGGQTEHE